MAMTPRKKKGIGFIVTAALFAVAGGVFVGTDVTPDWLNVVFAGISALAGVFGLVIIVPDTKD
jgi:hypothetical protein